MRILFVLHKICRNLIYVAQSCLNTFSRGTHQLTNKTPLKREAGEYERTGHPHCILEQLESKTI